MCERKVKLNTFLRSNRASSHLQLDTWQPGRSHFKIWKQGTSSASVFTERWTTRRHKMSSSSPSSHINCQPVVLNTPRTSQSSSLVLDEAPGKCIPACIKRPVNSNLALPPSMLHESVVHNAFQQQDRGNYHNQKRGSSISGEPQGVNEAERRRRRERWVSAWEKETEGYGERGEWAPCLLVPPKLQGFMSENCHPHN